MAAGALVIHSHLPVLEETSRGAALTFDAQSASQLAESLRKAAGDPALAARLRAEGLTRAGQLTWDGAVKATLDAYRSVIGS